MGLFFHVSSMYSTITRDSETDFSPWIRTGTFLWTGLYLRSNSLLLPRFSSKNLYSTPLNLRAICTLHTKGLPITPKSFTSSWFVAIVCGTSNLDSIQYRAFYLFVCLWSIILSSFPFIEPPRTIQRKPHQIQNTEISNNYWPY